MGTLNVLHAQVDGSQRLLSAIEDSLGQGHLGLAREQAVLLVRVLEGHQVPTCVSCGLALSDEEIDRFTSWCAEDAPVLGLRFED